MSGTKGRWRLSHKPQPSAAATAMPMMAKTACALVSQAVEMVRMVWVRRCSAVAITPAMRMKSGGQTGKV
jgi:hypothetical protein